MNQAVLNFITQSLTVALVVYLLVGTPVVAAQPMGVQPAGQPAGLRSNPTIQVDGTPSVATPEGDPIGARQDVGPQVSSQPNLSAADELERIDQTRRVESIGLICILVVGLLAIMFLSLRLNHASRGIYSRRILLFATLSTVALLACIAAVLFLIWR